MKGNKIKTVEVLQIAAGLAAALRWAISFMPLDGVRFNLSSNGIFEAASFIMSLAFAAVEVGATAYMMRAWRKEQDAKTRKALAALWVSAPALTVFAQVPPLLANINSQGVNEYPFWFQAAWVTASVAVTFVTIGGLGYSEKSLEAPQAKTVEAHLPTAVALYHAQERYEANQESLEAKVENAFACDKCDRAFATQNALIAHARIHKNGHAVEALENAMQN